MKIEKPDGMDQASHASSQPSATPHAEPSTAELSAARPLPEANSAISNLVATNLTSTRIQSPSIASSPLQSASDANALYSPDGKINRTALNNIVLALKDAVELSSSSRFTKNYIQRNLRKVLNGEVKQEKFYGTLKSLSSAIRNDGKSDEVNVLSDLMLQLARSHNYLTNKPRYDAPANAVTEKLLRDNPGLDTRANATRSDAAFATVKGGAELGVAASLTAGVNATAKRTKIVTKDIDGGANFIALWQGGLAGSAQGDVGAIAPNTHVAQVQGTLGVTRTLGRLFEGESTGDVVRHAFAHEREGGSKISSKMAPTRAKVKELINVRTPGTFDRLLRSLVHKGSLLQYAPLADHDSELNMHKLVKGGDPWSTFLGDQSILNEFPQFKPLQEALDRAFEGVGRGVKPKSLGRITSDANWSDVGVNGSLNAKVLKAALGTWAAISGGGIKVTGELSHRWLPFKAWLAPHDALGVLSDAKTQTKEALLARIVENDPPVARYMKMAKMGGATRIQQDLDTFEKHANTMLSMRSIFNSKQSSAALRGRAERNFHNSLETLSRTFALDDLETKGVLPSNERLESMLARCWNRLSLGLATVGPDLPTEDKALLDTLGTRIAEPDLDMPSTHLYHAASVQLEAAPRRLRGEGTFALELPGISVGTDKTVKVQAPSLGNLSGKLTYDNISQHSNLLRNGEDLTLEITATHPPGVAFTDTVAQSIATRCANLIQGRMDKAEMSKTDKALVGSISATLASGAANPASAEIDGSSGVSRQFKLALHRSDKGEPWRLALFQPANVESQSVSLQAQAHWTAGVGANVGAQVGRNTTNTVVRPLILGSDPSIHLLQSYMVKDNLLDENEEFSNEKTTFERMRNTDVATTYFSNDTILDTLESMQKIKSDKDSKADVFGRIARFPQNKESYDEFAKSGLRPAELHNRINAARTATSGLAMEERLRYFTTDDTGRSLLREYAEGIKRFSDMTSRAAHLVANADGPGFTMSVLDAMGKKHNLEIPAPVQGESAQAEEPDSPIDDSIPAFPRNSPLRRAMRRPK